MTTVKLQNPDFGYCVNDSVVFKVEIAVYGELQPACAFSGLESNVRNIRLPTLSSCLKKLLISGDLSDVTIVLEKGRLSAHRLVLIARSPVFRAMLQNDTVERATGVIEIDDVENDVMQECLNFMYTDACSCPSVSHRC